MLHIERKAVDITRAGITQLAVHCLQQFDSARAQQQLRSEPRKCLRGGGANPGTCAGDEYDLVLHGDAHG